MSLPVVLHIFFRPPSSCEIEGSVSDLQPLIHLEKLEMTWCGSVGLKPTECDDNEDPTTNEEDQKTGLGGQLLPPRILLLMLEGAASLRGLGGAIALPSRSDMDEGNLTFIETTRKFRQHPTANEVLPSPSRLPTPSSASSSLSPQ